MTTDTRAVADAKRERRAVTIVITVAVLAFWLISTSWRPWNLFEQAGFSADFYDEQARSFLRGRLAVRPEVAAFEGFLIDGKTYLYYGPFLAIVRLPLALFGDLFVARLVRLSMMIAMIVIGRWTARLARAASVVVADATSVPRTRTSDRTGADGAERSAPLWPVPFLVAATMCSPVLFAAGWTSVYHETEIWAVALAIVSITLIAEWAAAGFDDRRRLLWAVAAVIGTTMTRAPIGLGIAVGFWMIGLYLMWTSRDRRGRDGWIPVVGGVTPLMAYAMVNVAKFGTLFSVPGDRQVLSLNDPTRAAFFESTGGSFFDLAFLPTTLAQYLRPDTIRFERLVPGIRFGPLAENLGALDVETVTPASSIPVSATALLILGLIGMGWLLAHRARLWSVLIAGGVAGAIPTFMIGFVANRYLIDMLPPLITASAIGVGVVGRTRPSRLLRTTGVIVIVWGAWVNASLATWTLELKSPGFTELRSDLDAALFGNGDVGTVERALGSADIEVPRDGIVGFAPDCAGTYVAEQGRWVAIERKPGIYELGGSLSDIDVLADRPLRLAHTSGWTLDAVSSHSGGVAFVYATPADQDAAVVVVEAVFPIDYRVIVDPVTSETLIEVGDVVALIPRSALDTVTTQGLGPPTSMGPSTTSAPLCRKLVERSGTVVDR